MKWVGGSRFGETPGKLSSEYGAVRCGETRASCGQPPCSHPAWAVSGQARRGEFILSFQGEEAGKKKEREHQSNFSLDFKLHNNILSMCERIERKKKSPNPPAHKSLGYFQEILQIPEQSQLLTVATFECVIHRGKKCSSEGSSVCCTSKINKS